MLALLPRLPALSARCADRQPPPTPDDLCQATVEKALVARAASGKPGTRMDSWMYRIMRNGWIDTARGPRPAPGQTFLPEEAGLAIGDNGRPHDRGPCRAR